MGHPAFFQKRRSRLNLNCEVGFGNLGLKAGYANLQIGGFYDAIQENGVPVLAGE
jgi:hypothetical protein